MNYVKDGAAATWESAEVPSDVSSAKVVSTISGKPAVTLTVNQASGDRTDITSDAAISNFKAAGTRFYVSELDLSNISSVSYTHLDVYKRQPQTSPRRLPARLRQLPRMSLPLHPASLQQHLTTLQNGLLKSMRLSIHRNRLLIPLQSRLAQCQCCPWRIHTTIIPITRRLLVLQIQRMQSTRFPQQVLLSSSLQQRAV